MKHSSSTSTQFLEEICHQIKTKNHLGNQKSMIDSIDKTGPGPKLIVIDNFNEKMLSQDICNISLKMKAMNINIVFVLNNKITLKIDLTNHKFLFVDAIDRSAAIDFLFDIKFGSHCFFCLVCFLFSVCDLRICETHIFAKNTSHNITKTSKTVQI